MTENQDALVGLDHEKHLRRAIALADSAAAKGNHPFGASLVGMSGEVILDVENTVVDEHDDTCHAEVNLIRIANRKMSVSERARTVMYASTEPCAMCAAAMFWSGFRNVVFGASQERLYQISTNGEPEPPVLAMSCREVFAKGPNAKTTVIGPMLEAEAEASHVAYWPAAGQK